VTCAVSVPAAAGIPVTHRGLAKQFTVISGHDGLDWPSLATVEGTLVFLMAVSRLADTTAQLIAHGKDGAAPAAVLEDGDGPGQRLTTGTLADIADKAAEANVKPPAVVVSATSRPCRAFKQYRRPRMRVRGHLWSGTDVVGASCSARTCVIRVANRVKNYTHKSRSRNLTWGNVARSYVVCEFLHAVAAQSDRRVAVRASCLWCAERHPVGRVRAARPRLAFSSTIVGAQANSWLQRHAPGRRWSYPQEVVLPPRRGFFDQVAHAVGDIGTRQSARTIVGKVDSSHDCSEAPPPSPPRVHANS
jgi:hypothetical protein